MKRVTASEARRSWFRLLDEIAGGECVEIDRKGVRIVLRRQPHDEPAAVELPDYRDLISAPDADGADGWSWEWAEGALELRDEPPA